MPTQKKCTFPLPRLDFVISCSKKMRPNNDESRHFRHNVTADKLFARLFCGCIRVMVAYESYKKRDMTKMSYPSFCLHQSRQGDEIKDSRVFCDFNV